MFDTIYSTDLMICLLGHHLSITLMKILNLAVLFTCFTPMDDAKKDANHRMPFFDVIPSFCAEMEHS